MPQAHDHHIKEQAEGGLCQYKSESVLQHFRAASSHAVIPSHMMPRQSQTTGAGVFLPGAQATGFIWSVGPTSDCQSTHETDRLSCGLHLWVPAPYPSFSWEEGVPSLYDLVMTTPRTLLYLCRCMINLACQCSGGRLPMLLSQSAGGHPTVPSIQ